MVLVLDLGSLIDRFGGMLRLASAFWEILEMSEVWARTSYLYGKASANILCETESWMGWVLRAGGRIWIMLMETQIWLPVTGEVPAQEQGSLWPPLSGRKLLLRSCLQARQTSSSPYAHQSPIAAAPPTSLDILSLLL